MKKFLESMLEDNTGGTSSLRVITCVWFAVLFLAWIVVSFIKRELAEIPGSVLALSASLLTAKVAQRTQEKVTTTESVNGISQTVQT